MSNVLVISKGTGQSKSFQKVMDEYTVKNNLPIEWIYASDKNYIEEISNKEIKVVIISPEVMLVEASIKAELDSRGIKYISIKPSAFGLKQTEKFMPDVLKYIEE
jgi:PTS system cellobiose-specific IIB component